MLQDELKYSIIHYILSLRRNSFLETIFQFKDVLECDFSELFATKDTMQGFTLLNYACQHANYEMIMQLISFANENEITLNLKKTSKKKNSVLHSLILNTHIPLVSNL